MKHVNSLAACLLLWVSVFIHTSCSFAGDKVIYPIKTVLVGSTPGDDFIKSMLFIPAQTKVDFIRWNLQLTTSAQKKQTFLLDIAFGEVLANTLGFKKNGDKKTIEGDFVISKNAGKNGAAVYHLRSKRFLKDILLTKLNDNVFHLLGSDKRLLIGNGGWSYTLNNKIPVQKNFALPVLSPPGLKDDNAVAVIFDGRTPCQEFAREHHMDVSSSCFKLKWKLILNRDPVHHKPTTYSFRKVVDNVPQNITGKWAIVKGTPSNPGAIIYQLDPDKAEKTIRLFAGDENVLFFMHQNKQLFVGNADFSFTLNRRIQ